MVPAERLLLLVLLVLVPACGDTSGPVGVGSFEMLVPDSAVTGHSFSITVTALRADGTGPDASVSGAVALSASAGTLTPTTLELSAGSGSAQATISDATGSITLTAEQGDRSGSAVLAVRTATEITELPGEPQAPAAGQIPRMPFEARIGDYAEGHPDVPGTPLSFNTLLLVLQPGVMTGAANALLDEIDAEIVGGIPGRAGSTSGILFLRTPATAHSELDTTLQALRQDERVRHAAPDVILGPRVVSQPNAGTPPDWSWELTPTGGNWGLELVRAPQMWNLREAILREFAPGLLTAVLDVGFEDHPDIHFIENQTPGVLDDHGAHVAGIIGARFDNGLGIDGINPFARLVVRADATPVLGMTALDRGTSWGNGFVDELEALIRAQPEIRVINTSMGYPWDGDQVNTTANLEAQELASAHGAIFKEMLATLADDGVGLPVIVTAAGNESADGAGPQLADYGSPMNNAAIEHGAANMIVVEADSLIAATGNVVRSGFSNIGGHLSAPGSQVLSLSLLPEGYHVESGTSMATPHVAGLVGYLYRLEPELPSPTLSSNPIRELLRSTAVDKPGAGTPHIDAFAAVMAVDALRGNDRVLRMLVDVDDGTLDGNRRMDTDGSVDTVDVRGDGNVDMRDFRRWRDWLLQTEDAPALALDGAADHPKKDLNGDGQVGTAAEENVYPRGDFNGDGVLSRDATAYVPGAIDAEVTDLQVLQAVFDDPVYEAGELPGLIESADIHVDATSCLAGADVVEVVTSVLDAEAEAEVRSWTHSGSETEFVYTVPSNPDGYGVRASARDGSGNVLGTAGAWVSAELGGDDAWTPSCGGLVAEVVFPDSIEVDTPTPLIVRAGWEPLDGGPVEYEADQFVEVTASTGTVTPASGFTDEDGYFQAEVTAQGEHDTITLTITVTTEDGEVTRTVEADVVIPPAPLGFEYEALSAGVCGADPIDSPDALPFAISGSYQDPMFEESRCTASAALSVDILDDDVIVIEGTVEVEAYQTLRRGGWILTFSVDSPFSFTFEGEAVQTGERGAARGALWEGSGVSPTSTTPVLACAGIVSGIHGVDCPAEQLLTGTQSPPHRTAYTIRGEADGVATLWVRLELAPM